MLLKIKAVDFVAELIGVPQAATEYRRGEARLDARAPVDVVVLRTTASAAQPVRGRTLNVASDSLAVVCRQPVSAGSRVRVTLPSGRFCDADVVHCTQTVGGYKIGMKLD